MNTNPAYLRELLIEALDELKAHLIVMQQEMGRYEFSRGVKPWCKYCHRFGGHTDDCLITRIEAATKGREAQP